MPELPEVETIVRALAPRLTRRHIVSAEFLSPLVVRHSEPDPEIHLTGRVIESVERRGKFVVARLDRGFLTVHLGMTGKLLLDAARTPYTRAVFGLDRGSLLFDDVRQFGSVEWSEGLPARVRKLGPEPLDISFEDLAAALRRRNAPVKALLLNQTILRGLGNIYVDESLFRARIRPSARAVSPARIRRLHTAIREVIGEAIAHRGSSISDYVDPCGEEGGFQQMHRVYGREGEACVACGGAIRRIVLAQRGTHFCPRCQR